MFKNVLRVAELTYYLPLRFQTVVRRGMNTYNQLQNLLRMEKMAINNLKNVANVRSYGDFMAWYNRQLYMEKQAQDMISNTSIKIGGKSYPLIHIKELAEGLNDNFGAAYWKAEFSESQRREMWYNLGLAPSSYAYLKTWGAMTDSVLDKMLTKSKVSSKEYQEDMQTIKEFKDKLAEDATKPEDEKMQEKEMLSMLTVIEANNNKVLNDMKTDMADQQELIASLLYESKAPPNPPELSESWDESPFGPLTD